MILDLDTFHILAADVQDTVDIGIEEGSRIIMGDGFDFPFIQHQGSLHEGFTVSGGTGPGDMRVLGQHGIDLLYR